jgi:hypothetical protein
MLFHKPGTLAIDTSAKGSQMMGDFSSLTPQLIKTCNIPKTSAASTFVIES